MHLAVVVEGLVMLAQGALDFDRGLDRLDDAVEGGEHAVAGGIDDAPPVRRDVFGEDFAVLGQRAHGGALVVGHQPAVAGDVGGENGGELSQSLVNGHLFVEPRKYSPG